MEHYDGPAFYRKFPVKPTPVKREDPITERAASQVKQRQRRNAQSEQRPVPPVTATPAPSDHPETPNQPAGNGNYRPFQVTEIPKQLHWSHRITSGRQRYQRLIQQLKKSADSFLLFAQPGSETPAAPTLTAEVVTPSAEPVATPTHPTAPAAGASAPAAQTEVFQPDPNFDRSASTPASAAATDHAPVVTPGRELMAEPAPTEVFYPESLTFEPTVPADSGDEPVAASAATPSVAEKSVAEEETAAQPVPSVTTEASEASLSTDESASAAEPSEEPEPSVKLKNSEQSITLESAEAPAEGSTTAEHASTVANADDQPETTDDAPTTPDEPSTPVRPTTTVDYLPVGTVPAPQGRGVVTESPATEVATEKTPSDPDVQRLLARAEDGPTLASETPDSPAKSASETNTASVTASSPDAETSTSAATVTSVSATQPETPTPTAPAATPAPKAKAKPSRGLGHSLGDIMQEEGNEQRNLALFADAAPAPESTAPADDAPIRGYHFPDLSLLPKPVVPDEAALDEWIEHQAEVLDTTLTAFHVDAHVTDWTIGPTVTQFQIKLALGVKVNKITNLNDDLKLALAAKDIRIEAPIPGKPTVGIEIPNKKSRPVMLSEILNSPAFKKSESPLTVALGVDLFGQPQVTDLRKMPHGLIAGATGSGKSVFINSLLLSILYKANPRQVKLLLIDPKAVEMAPYDGLPHLLAPVISDPKAAAAALKWVVTEMDERYEKLAAAGVRNIEQFNDRADANDEPGLKMPYIVIIIDELADLMMMAASEVQDYIVRITQKARAAGIHLLVATQRPSVDIVTGTIKNNIPTRIAFMVSSQIDSRTILDTTGAESLLGRGDMLYLGNGASQPMRLQGAFVESEVDRVTDFVRTQGKPQYAFEPNGLLKQETAAENQDELLPKVLEYIAQEKTVSTSKLQRVFSIGYNRAANLIDDLEQHNYVSPQHGSKPREVYLTPDDLGKDLPEPHDQGAPFSS